ncbi:hypothetical protein [Streptosporangium canum]|uniref:hypothetical protein n=1 Tax=Streptosporangium canum TaxID=324952 RepID=UPI0037B8DBB0
MNSDVESTLRAEMQAESALRFIDTLEIEALSPPLIQAGSALTEGASAAVAGGSVVAFTDRLNGKQKSDVLNSLLLAQLAANKRHDRERDSEKWYKFYRSVLEQIGWVTPEFAFTKLSGTSTRFTVDGAVIALLQAIATQNEIAVARAAIDALKELQDRDKRVVIFETNSHSAAFGNFQIGTCDVSPQETVVVKIGAFYFSTTETVTRVLFFNFPRNSTQMSQKGQTMTLNEDVYGQVRDAVIEKLGDNAIQFIAELEI